MSRSNPSDAISNPSTRWFEFDGGATGGFVRYYDKEQEKNVNLGDPSAGSNFTFILLDELATVKGWHDASDSGIYANEVRDTRQEVLVVKAFKAGELLSGLYASVKDRIVSAGGQFVASCYIAYKDGDELRIGNIRFKGATLSAWMDFKKQCPSKKDARGRSVKAYFVDAVKIKGFEQGKKGSITYRTPVFTLATLSEETNAQAVALDAELQAYLSDYLKRPRAEAAKAPAPEHEEHGETAPDEYQASATTPPKNWREDRTGLPDTQPVGRRDIRGMRNNPEPAPFSDEPQFAVEDIPF